MEEVATAVARSPKNLPLSKASKKEEKGDGELDTPGPATAPTSSASDHRPRSSDRESGSSRSLGARMREESAAAGSQSGPRKAREDPFGGARPREEACATDAPGGPAQRLGSPRQPARHEPRQATRVGGDVTRGVERLSIDDRDRRGGQDQRGGYGDGDRDRRGGHDQRGGYGDGDGDRGSTGGSGKRSYYSQRRYGNEGRAGAAASWRSTGESSAPRVGDRDGSGGHDQRGGYGDGDGDRGSTGGSGKRSYYSQRRYGNEGRAGAAASWRSTGESSAPRVGDRDGSQGGSAAAPPGDERERGRADRSKLIAYCGDLKNYLTGDAEVYVHVNTVVPEYAKVRLLNWVAPIGEEIGKLGRGTSFVAHAASVQLMHRRPDGTVLWLELKQKTGELISGFGGHLLLHKTEGAYEAAMRELHEESYDVLRNADDQLRRKIEWIHHSNFVAAESDFLQKSRQWGHVRPFPYSSGRKMSVIVYVVFVDKESDVDVARLNEEFKAHEDQIDREMSEARWVEWPPQNVGVSWARNTSVDLWGDDTNQKGLKFEEFMLNQY
eukprot:m51a1_g13021 hypothetical protein (552) ;mRNA; r:569-3196